MFPELVDLYDTYMNDPECLPEVAVDLAKDICSAISTRLVLMPADMHLADYLVEEHKGWTKRRIAAGKRL